LRQLPEEFKVNKFVAKEMPTLPVVKALIKAAIPECSEVLTVVCSSAKSSSPLWSINRLVATG
jgi:hypothetical protein